MTTVPMNDSSLRIERLLARSPLTLRQLISRSGLSRTTVAVALQALRSARRIEPCDYEGEDAYRTVAAAEVRA